MVVKSGTTVSEGSIDGTLTERGRARGGSAVFLADRWFDFPQDINASIQVESQDGLAKAAFDYVSDNAPDFNLSPPVDNLEEPIKPDASDYLKEGSDEANSQNTATTTIGCLAFIAFPAAWWFGNIWWALLALVILGFIGSLIPEKEIVKDPTKALEEAEKIYQDKLTDYINNKEQLALEHEQYNEKLVRHEQQWRDLWASRVCVRCGHIYPKNQDTHDLPA